MAGLKLVGEYQPADDSKRWVFIYTSSEIQNAVKKFKGLRGFALTQRVVLTTQEDRIFISYTNPIYWGAAYFQDDYEGVSNFYVATESKMMKLASSLGVSDLKPFGSEEGIEIEDLQDYQYMFGMPYFDDVVDIAEFDNHQTAVSTIDRNLKSKPNQNLVYKYQLPNSELMLYGVELDGEKGENKFLPIIDIDSPNHTCFLPYEILVSGNEVFMLHGRYRIALSIPDLTMGTFTKIMSTPGEIEDAMKELVK